MATTQPVTDWKKEWFEIEDAAYLNTAAHAAMPRVSLRAVQASLEAKDGKLQSLRTASPNPVRMVQVVYRWRLR